MARDWPRRSRSIRCRSGGNRVQTVGVVGHVGDLSPSGAEDTYDFLGPRDLADAAAWVRARVSRLLTLPRDAHGVPLMDACPPRRSHACATCTMQRACELSVTQEG